MDEPYAAISQFLKLFNYYYRRTKFWEDHHPSLSWEDYFKGRFHVALPISYEFNKNILDLEDLIKYQISVPVLPTTKVI